MLIPNVSDIDKKILAYDVDGRKDILGLWIQKTESKHFGMQILDYPSAVRKIMYTTNAI